MFLANVSKLHRIESPNILEIGSDGFNYLGKFFPQARVTPANLYPENLRDLRADFIEADAADLNMLENNSYDFVISLAVLEHVPHEKHKAFFGESYRVAKIGVFHAAPFDEDFVIQAERNVSDHYEMLNGVKHRWIEEHFANGHPSMAYIREILGEIGCDYCVFEHMDIEIWELFYKMQLTAQAHGSALSEECGRFYADKLFHHDASEQNVFKHIYISKTELNTAEYLQKIKSKFPDLSKETCLHEVEVFRKHLEKLIQLEQQRTDVRRKYILDFIDKLTSQQSIVYLYGVTHSLLFWLDTIQDARDCDIRVFDTYQSGSLKRNRNRPDIKIERPGFKDLSEKTVVVFPDVKYPEIFRQLESVNANPLFYRDIAK
ncbi:MAG: class I SAM-dependent methyltransferase [Dysgonamonadaceae bacterium]|nr:class I SAM-dependent methyltransferase [Dysgonamonadaceae bacterium]